MNLRVLIMWSNHPLWLLSGIFHNKHVLPGAVDFNFYIFSIWHSKLQNDREDTIFVSGRAVTDIGKMLKPKVCK